MWVYLFFCANKIESFGRNTQAGVGFRQKSGNAVWIREAMVIDGGWVQGAQACELGIWVSKGIDLKWTWGRGYYSRADGYNNFVATFF